MSTKLIAVDRLGSWIASATFQKIPRPVGRLGLGSGSTYVVGRLKLGPHVVGRLGSGVWVSASFQIFALTAGERPEGNCPGRECPGVLCPREGNVLHWINRRTYRRYY